MERTRRPGRSTRVPDILGMIVSISCGLHCLALTLLFFLYPALWLNRRYWEIGLWQKLLWIEWSLLATAAGLILLAMTLGWWRHRRRLPACLALLGLAALAAATLTPLHFKGFWGSLLALAGGIMVAGAHWLNLRR